MPELQTLLTGLAFGESPRWSNGRLWFSDFGAQEVVTVDLDDKKEVIAHVPGAPMGLGFRLCCKKSSRNAMATKSLFTLRSGSHFKQIGDECDLTYDVGFIYPSHLPLPHHVHDFISLQGSPCALEGKEA